MRRKLLWCARRKETARGSCLVLVSFSLACLSACSVGPDYFVPGLDLPKQYSERGGPARPRSDLTGWWRTFRDPVLDRLVEESVAGNLGVAAAAARIRAARSTRREAIGSTLPILEATGIAKQSKIAGAGGEVAWQFQMGLDASWELDLFGGRRRAIEAAIYAVDAANEDLRATLMTLIGDVALNYVELRGAQTRISLARRTAASQRETVKLTRGKFDAGSSSNLEVANATALATSTEALIPLLETNRALSVHRLGILLGREPGAVAQRLSGRGRIPVPSRPIHPGAPADLLSRRPDVARAERLLAQATANIGVADAALYPSVNLTGSISTSASRIGDLGKGSTIGWSWGPSLTVPLFAGGSLIAAVDVADAQRDQSLLAFQSAVLSAMEDVENALVALTQDHIREGRLARAARSYGEAAKLSRTLWQAGTSGFLEVLDAERSNYSAEDSLIQSRVAIATDAIALSKALGGGWDDPIVVDTPLIIDVDTGPHLPEGVPPVALLLIANPEQ